MKNSCDIKDPYLLMLSASEISEGTGKQTKRYIFDDGSSYNAYEQYKI